MTDPAAESLPTAETAKFWSRCNVLRRGVSLEWPAAWLIAIVLALVPLMLWWFSWYPYYWRLEALKPTSLAWIYFAPPLILGAIWKSGKVFATALFMPWVMLLMEIAWLVLRYEFQDFRWP